MEMTITNEYPPVSPSFFDKGNRGGLSASYFANASLPSGTADEPFMEEKKRFFEIADSRMEYLDTLKDIKWSSDYKEPSQASIEQVKRVLLFLKDKVRGGQISIPQMPGVLVGPMPVGGLGVELHFPSDFSLSIDFYNDRKNQFEMEVEEDGFYREPIVQGVNALESCLREVLRQKLEKLQFHKPNFKKFLLSCPKLEVGDEIVFERQKDLPRDIDL